MVSSKLPLRSTSNRFVSFLATFYYLFEGIFSLLTPDSWRYKNMKGQIVLITGSGSGIGQLMAIRFAQIGCRLVLWDINESGMRETVRLIAEKKLDADLVHLYKVNLASREEIYATARQVLAEHGPVDCLVNNAGVVSGDLFLDTPDEKNILTFNVNTLAHFYTIKAFLPEMIKQGRGHIVTTASVAGHSGGGRMVDYCASKHANVGMDLALRMELGQAGLEKIIKTTIVKPYLISTGMFAGCQPFLFSALEPDYVAQRVVSAVLAERETLTLPGVFTIISFLLQVLPAKCIVPLLWLGGARELTDGFTGRNPNGKVRIHELNRDKVKQ